MIGHFEIQARICQRRDGILVRDESRRDRADTLDEAVQSAQKWLAAGFTVWIYRVERSGGVSPTYRSIQTLHPGNERSGPSGGSTAINP